MLQRAATQTEARAKEPTRSGQEFTRLVAYFFSSLDYWLSRVPAKPKQKQAERQQPTQTTPTQRVPEGLQRRIEAAALTFRDKAVKSSVKRAANLMAKAHIDEARMCELVDEARATTSAACNVRARMPYFFSILEKNIAKLGVARV